MTLKITQEQLLTAQKFAVQGNYAEGWKYLASVDDRYADNAYTVTTGNTDGVIDQSFKLLVKNHWLNTAGEHQLKAYSC
jgi:hypothetical protein